MLQVSRRGSVQDVSELSRQEDRALRQAFGRFGDPEARAAGAAVVHRYQRAGAGCWLLCDCLGRVDWPPALIPVAEAHIRRHYDPPWPAWVACTAPQGVATIAELLLKAPSELNLRPVTGNDLLHREG